MVNLQALNPFGYTVKAATEIADLRVYPIKSCRGFSVKSSTLTRQGLDLDRNWMFVDRSQNNKFITIREVSELTLIDTALVSPSTPDAEQDTDLVISVRGQPQLKAKVPARPSRAWLEANTKLEEVTIWGTQLDGWIYNDSVSKPFADYLGKPIALVYKGPRDRVLQGNGSPKELGRTETTNFPDVLPLLIANEQSLYELNTRLEAKGETGITIERFRPNVIVKGNKDNIGPWTEDDWRLVRIVQGPPASGVIFSSGPSNIEIDVVAHCARCQVPNVDPRTAEKHRKEPWDTLVSYRRIDEGIKFKPCFGMLCCPRSEGPVSVGMKLEVLEVTKNHIYKKGF